MVAHQFGVHDLDERLTRIQRGGQRPARVRAFLTSVGELLDHRQRDVGLEQRHAHVPAARPLMFSSDRLRLAGDPPERFGQSFGQAIEQKWYLSRDHCQFDSWTGPIRRRSGNPVTAGIKLPDYSQTSRSSRLVIAPTTADSSWCPLCQRRSALAAAAFCLSRRRRRGSGVRRCCNRQARGPTSSPRCIALEHPAAVRSARAVRELAH